MLSLPLCIHLTGCLYVFPSWSKQSPSWSKQSPSWSKQLPVQQNWVAITYIHDAQSNKLSLELNLFACLWYAFTCTVIILHKDWVGLRYMRCNKDILYCSDTYYRVSGIAAHPVAVWAVSNYKTASLVATVLTQSYQVGFYLDRSHHQPFITSAVDRCIHKHTHSLAQPDSQTAIFSFMAKKESGTLMLQFLFSSPPCLPW